MRCVLEKEDRFGSRLSCFLLKHIPYCIREWHFMFLRLKEEIGGEKKMKKGKAQRKLYGNEKAVSPVIGVVLMVAITVVLAAVIAGFVFGIGMRPITPQASFAVKSCSYDAGAGSIVLEHQGGDSIPLADISGTIDPDGASGTKKPETANWVFRIDINGNDVIDPGDQIESIATAPTSGDRYSYTIFHTPTGQAIATGEVTATD